RCPRAGARPPAPPRRPPSTAPSPASGRDELAALRADAVEQLRERVRELLHALPLERVDDVVVVDAGLGDLLEYAPRLVQVSLKRERHLAMVFEGRDRLLRHRVDRLGADQVLDVEHVAVVRVLRRGRGPEAALRRGALRAQRLPALAGEELLVALVGELR